VDEETPDEWKKGTIIELPKRGDMEAATTGEASAFYHFTSKLFSRIVLKRINKATDHIIKQEQAGLRKGKTCIYHIFT